MIPWIGFLLVVCLGGPAGGQDKIIRRTPSMEMYKCTDCHDSPSAYNNTLRVLTEEHLEIEGVHFIEEKDERWCTTCHQPGNYNRLRLLSGADITFNETYRLCGECHAVVFDDWKKNIHGKRIGYWKGPKEIFSCMECHNPHSPRFKEMEAVAKPVRPRNKDPLWARIRGLLKGFYEYRSVRGKDRPAD